MSSSSASGRSQAATILGDFELGKVIGRGGMGTVYEAWQRSLRRPVALKVLAGHIAASPKAVQRFQREAQAAAKLHHTHIVPIFAQGSEGGVYYYAMELIHGRGLNAIISEIRDRQTASTADLAETIPLPREGEVSGAEASGLGSQPARGGSSSTLVTLGKSAVMVASDEYFSTIALHVAAIADALEYAHGEGVIHRDIKPHNLILGDDGRMRIADFGLARVVEEPGVTVTGEMVGSPLYMSPEQITAGPTAVDHRADIYSLGATMYEWLTLRPPHPGETREAVISKILSSDAPPLRAHNPEIPVDLETVCRKAIERDPAHRYRTAAELRDDLQRYLDRRPIKASPAGFAERLRKYFGRHQLGSIAMVASAAIVVALGLAWALYSKQHEVETQTAAAVEAQEQADEILDMLSMVIPGGEAAGSVIEDLVETGQVITLGQGGQEAAGVTPEDASTPEGIARRATHDIYEVLAPTDLSAAEETDAYLGVFRSALEMREENPERALGHLNVYLDQRADDFDALQLRTALHGQLRDYEQMIADAEHLVRIRTDSPVAYLWRGLARLLLGQTDPCLEDLRRAEELDAIAVWARALQGVALIQIGRPADAIAALDGVLASSPELVIAMLGRASAYTSIGDASAAVSDLSQVCELEKDNADALAARGECHAALGDLDAAIADFDQAMRIGGRTQAMVIRYLTIKMQQRAIESAAAAERERAKQADEASKEQVESWFSRWVYPRTPPEGG